ncbi:hypothetical protein CPB84DRAFT_1841893 [Gymnopilus junonius]|uniref:Cyclin N-terminal domain-containing protein n=1 Tax=Gymnopilus junonius TaxID=109634 RepID=A0A9P5P0A8_GYMJU|nr:hypothetical protein CPB84DRAFT_1841893 [Gymnopilus junonius]
MQSWAESDECSGVSAAEEGAPQAGVTVGRSAQSAADWNEPCSQGLHSSIHVASIHSPVSAQMASPSSTSSSSSSVHHASLVDPALHSPELLELIDVKVSRQVIDYTIDTVIRNQAPEHLKFTTFVTDVLTRAEVTMPTLLAALVYIDRARPHLHIGLEQWALERVFLGALIVASKFLNDSTLKNVHWAMCTGVFGKRDVGRIEREYLDVLNFELKVTEDDLLNHYEGLSELLPLSLRHSPQAPPPPASTSSLSFSNSTKSSERRHTRRRSPTTYVPNVPELSPPSPISSPESDSSSLDSPKTPSSTSSIDMDVDISSGKVTPHSHISHHRPQPHAKHQLPQPHHPGTARKMINAATQFSTMDLLRSFPIPRLMTTSSS